MDLIKHAKDIPSMGGREMGIVFDRFISCIPDNTDIVEIGTWLGAGTAQLSLSVTKHGKDSVIHSYDRFKASTKDCLKAIDPLNYKYHSDLKMDGKGMPIYLECGQDTLPVVKDLLKPFDNIVLHKTDINKMKYSGRPISILVVDAAKKGKEFKRLMEYLSTFLIDGAVIFLMDFYFYRIKDKDSLRYQERYITKHPDYQVIESYPEWCTAVIKYKGAI